MGSGSTTPWIGWGSEPSSFSPRIADRSPRTDLVFIGADSAIDRDELRVALDACAFVE
ncbi:MAG: GTP-binding protein [Acidobacteria bacterium]|nr:GTP-binding protein [Acidobacteriota bacterium]MCH8129223.1 GTP-binding protein [Acidobacteriota bacterium]